MFSQRCSRFAFVLMFTFLSGPAFAIGSGGGGGGGSSDRGSREEQSFSKPKPLKCPRGKIQKQKNIFGKYVKKCVLIKTSGLSADEMFRTAQEYALAHYYDEAIDVLNAMPNQREARVLDCKGYSNFHAGRIETGINYLRMALAVDSSYPFTQVHLGKAYFDAGFPELAKAELASIGKLKGSHSEEYLNLKSHIELGY